MMDDDKILVIVVDDGNPDGKMAFGTIKDAASGVFDVLDATYDPTVSWTDNETILTITYRYMSKADFDALEEP